MARFLLGVIFGLLVGIVLLSSLMEAGGEPESR